MYELINDVTWQQFAILAKNFACTIVCMGNLLFLAVYKGNCSQIFLRLDYSAAGMIISRQREKKEHSTKKRQIKRRKSKHESTSGVLDNKWYVKHLKLNDANIS